MKDSVILGTGNSRYLKSVADFKTLYPTYDDFAAALVAGTLPVDFNGINAAGFQQVGDALGKNTLLKDATAALFGLDATAVPDDVLAKVNNLIATLNSSVSDLTSNVNNKAQISAGSYVGNGYSGSSYPNMLTFNFKPHFFIIKAESNFNAQAMFFLDGLSSEYMTQGYFVCASDSNLSNANTYAKLVNNTVYWYSSISSDAQMNRGMTYYYFAIG